MKKLFAIFTGVAMAASMSASAFASSNPDVYVVNFRKDDNAASVAIDTHLDSAMAISGTNAEKLVVDTSNAAKWEAGAHSAFNRGIVPVFNKWVGLPGFVAIVDARSKRVLGCVNDQFSADEMAQILRKMASQAQGQAYMSNASSSSKTTTCPPAFNTPPK